MSDTPETDQEADSIVISSKGCCDIYAVKKNVTIGKNLVDADFARKLERERNALKLKNEKLYNIAKTAIRYLSQSYRNEFADEVRELRDEIEQIENRK
jgi:hypothetical protein